MKTSTFSFLLLAFTIVFSIKTFSQGTQVAREFGSHSGPYGYMEYLPLEYANQPNTDWPIIIFLHGIGETGGGTLPGLTGTVKNGPGKLIKNGRHFEAIVVSPQTSGGWSIGALNSFVDYCLNTYNIDENRVYVTGLSLGGGGAWNYGVNHANRVAAIVPICGAADVNSPENLIHTPIWAFHNSGDGTIAVGKTLGWINGIKAAGGNPLVTIYDRNGHDAWTRTYNDDNMWDWMFEQSRLRSGIRLNDFTSSSNHIPSGKSYEITFNVKVEDINSTIDQVTMDLTALGGSSNVTMTHNGGGNYSLNFITGSSIANGTATVTVNATNVPGYTNSLSLNLLVVDNLPEGEILYKTKVNVNQDSDQGGNWNNTSAYPGAGNLRYDNLIDNNGNATSIGFTVDDGFNAAGTGGAITGGNSGVYPDNVIETYYWLQNNTANFRVFGLDPSLEYEFIFFSSRGGIGTSRITNFTIGNQTVGVEARNNSSNTSSIVATPSNNGEVQIAISNSNNQYAYLNAFEIAALSPGFPDVDQGTVWNGSSWSQGAPNQSTNATINGNYNTGDLECNNLSINSGRKLTINNNMTVTVNGNLNINGELEVEDGGTIIIKGIASGNATIKRNSSWSNGRYSMVGSPVSGLSFASFPGTNVFQYNASNNTYISPNTTNMVAGKGYTSANYPSMEFTGTPNAGDIVTAIVSNTATDKGFNLVANPFSSAISFEDFIAGNNNINGTIWIWDDGGSHLEQRTSNDFLTINAAGVTGGAGNSGTQKTFNGYIGSVQGFFIKAESGNNILFTNEMKVVGNNSNESFFRTTEVKNLKLLIANSEMVSECLIAMSDDATPGHDRLYDADKLKTDKTFNIYSIGNNRHYAIQTIPPAPETIIPIGLDLAEGGEHNIRIKESILGFAVSLYDHELQKEITFESGGINLEIDEGVNIERFSIILRRSGLTGASLSSSSAVFLNQDKLNIRNSNTQPFEYNLKVYNTNGTLLYHEEGYDESGWKKLPFNQKRGLYIVDVLIDGNRKVQKIIK